MKSLIIKVSTVIVLGASLASCDTMASENSAGKLASSINLSQSVWIISSDIGRVAK